MTGATIWLQLTVPQAFTLCKRLHANSSFLYHLESIKCSQTLYQLYQTTRKQTVLKVPGHLKTSNAVIASLNLLQFASNISAVEISAANSGVQTIRSHNWKHPPGDEAKNRVQRCNPWRNCLIFHDLGALGVISPRQTSGLRFLLHKYKMKFSHEFSVRISPDMFVFSIFLVVLHFNIAVELSIPWKMMFQISFLHYTTFTT